MPATSSRHSPFELLAQRDRDDDLEDPPCHGPRRDEEQERESRRPRPGESHEADHDADDTGEQHPTPRLLRPILEREPRGHDAIDQRPDAEGDHEERQRNARLRPHEQTERDRNEAAHEQGRPSVLQADPRVVLVFRPFPPPPTRCGCSVDVGIVENGQERAQSPRVAPTRSRSLTFWWYDELADLSRISLMSPPDDRLEWLHAAVNAVSKLDSDDPHELRDARCPKCNASAFVNAADLYYESAAPFGGRPQHAE